MEICNEQREKLKQEDGLTDEAIDACTVKNAFRSGDYENFCLLFYFDVRCFNEDCRTCPLAQNPALVSRYLKELEVEIASLEIPETPEEIEAREAEAQRARESLIKMVDEMVAIIPASKWTKDMVAASCFQKGMPSHLNDIVYGSIKLRERGI